MAIKTGEFVTTFGFGYVDYERDQDRYLIDELRRLKEQHRRACGITESIQAQAQAMKQTRQMIKPLGECPSFINKKLLLCEI